MELEPEEVAPYADMMDPDMYRKKVPDTNTLLGTSAAHPSAFLAFETTIVSDLTGSPGRRGGPQEHEAGTSPPLSTHALYTRTSTRVCSLGKAGF